MDFNEFDNKIKKMEAEVKARLPELYKEFAIIGLRFVDDNFRNQGWEGKLWQANKRGGTILINRGVLRRSFNSNILQDGAEIYTNVNYAKVHNEGFKGEVSVKAHSRGKFNKAKKGKKKKTGTMNVKSFKRRMNLPQRQFAPTDNGPSATLDNRVNNAIKNFFKPILKSE